MPSDAGEGRVRPALAPPLSLLLLYAYKVRMRRRFSKCAATAELGLLFSLHRDGRLMLGRTPPPPPPPVVLGFWKLSHFILCKGIATPPQ